MTTRSGLRNLFASRTPRTIRKRPARSLLAVEALEERALLTVGFAPAVNTPLGPNAQRPVALALGNLNPDTNIDVVTANGDTKGSYSSQNGFGGGGFSIATADIGGNGPTDVALADFNGDGKLDLAVANSSSNDVTVALGRNTFSFPFGAPVEYPAGSAPVSVAVGDFNGDGKVDLVTANAFGNNISLLLGLGTGAFQAPVNYFLGSSPRSVEVGDFNGDGKLNLVTANSTDNSISVLLNTGIGTSTGTDTFVGAGRYDVGAFPVSLAVGDFNRDGKLDLVTANNTEGTISVLRNTGTSTLFIVAGNYFTGSRPTSVAVGDFDGDGKLNLVTANHDSNDVGVHMSNGDGTFQFPVSYAVGFGPNAVAVADVNRDGRPDIVTANTTSSSLSALLFNTAPTITHNPAGVVVKNGAQATRSDTFNDSGGRNTVTLTASLGTVTRDDAAGTWSWSYTPTSGPAAVNVTITATDNFGLTATTTFPLTVYTNASNAKFVQALYRYELGRNADPTGLTGWMGRFEGPDGQATVVSGIVNSAEGRNRLVGIWYQTYLGRSATAGEISTSATLLAGQTEEQVLSKILGSTEYFNRAQTRGFGGTANENLVLALFQDLLGRRPADVGFWVSRLQTRGQEGLALDLLQGLEYRGIVVRGYYTDLLGRTGSVDEVNSWASGTRDLRDIRKLFESGPGFFIRNATLAPTITSFSVPTAGNEGSPVTLSTTATNAAGPSFPLTYAWTVTRPNGTTLTTLSGPSATFTPPDNGNYGISLSVTDEDGFRTTRSATGAVANVPPTPTLSGFGTGLATQVLTYTASATDPSSIDQAAGFAYSINWGDGSALQSINRTAGNGSGVNVSHVFTTAGAYTVARSATDKDGGASTATRMVTVLNVTSANMQTVINQQGSISMQVTDNTQYQAAITAVNGLAAQPTPVTITVKLGSGTYSGTTASPKAGITLKLVGSGGTTTIVGASPSVSVTSGDVFLSDMTLTNATDAPTVQVSDGNLILRNVVIEESGAADQAAVLIRGGAVDLGRADDPGGNSFHVKGRGKLIRNTSPGNVSAVGNNYQVDDATLSSPYRIEDGIEHAVDNGSGGVVTFVPGNLYITVNGGSIQRGINVVASEGTVNVEPGSYKNFDVGSKLVTVRFEGGPTLSQQRNPQNADLRDVVVTGTDADDQVQFTPVGAGVQAQVRGVPNGRFAPTGQLVVHGGEGDDFISVAGGIILPAWLYGDAGDDALHGGGGYNVLLGGTGDDQLNGGLGRDLLIGGLGADRLDGNGGDDLLLAGTTAFDGDQAALDAVMAEWTSARSYADRVANLRGTGSGPDVTVFDDDSVDVLAGASGMDWFFASLSQDIIHGRRDSEIVESL